MLYLGARVTAADRHGEPRKSMSNAVGRGIVVGLWAGVPQVLIAQVVEKLLGLSRGKADIGPRFVERAANQLGTSLPPLARWLISALFHFGYASWWGALYGLADEKLRPPPAVGGLALGTVIWTAAFSPIGGGTQTGTEPHPRHRSWRDVAFHLSAAFSFSLIAAYSYDWLRGLMVNDAQEPFSAATRPPEPAASEPVRAW